LLSATHIYNARPDPLTRYLPAEPDVVLITVSVAVPFAVPPPAVLALLALLAGADPACAAVLPLLLQAAASSATAASGTPSLTDPGSRDSNEILILYSRLE
jgi:hypothetical protein